MLLNCEPYSGVRLHQDVSNRSANLATAKGITFLSFGEKHEHPNEWQMILPQNKNENNSWQIKLIIKSQISIYIEAIIVS